MSLVKDMIVNGEQYEIGSKAENISYNTTNVKEVLDNLPTSYAPINAEENVIETIKVNGSALTPASKAVDITVPTQASDIGALPDTTVIPSAPVELTQAEYDALPDSKLTDGIEYYITDSGAEPKVVNYTLSTDFKIYAKKYGRIVTVYINNLGQKILEANVLYDAATIPEELIPPCPTNYFSFDGDTRLQLYVNTNGKVQVRSTARTGWFSGTLTYIV